MLEEEGTVFTFLPHLNRSGLTRASALRGQAKEETLNPGGVRQRSQPRGGQGYGQAALLLGLSSKFTPSGFFRKLLPGVDAAEVSLPAPPAPAHFFG